MNVELRRMRTDDLGDVLRNERRGYTHPWSEGIFRDCLGHGYECWVLIEGSKTIGHGILSVAAGESHLLNVCVNPDCQGNGFGRVLVEHMLARAAAMKASTVFLEVRPSNIIAFQLYEKLGFNEVGVREGYYPAFTGREDAIVLAKELI